MAALAREAPAVSPSDEITIPDHGDPGDEQGLTAREKALAELRGVAEHLRYLASTSLTSLPILRQLHDAALDLDEAIAVLEES